MVESSFNQASLPGITCNSSPLSTHSPAQCLLPRTHPGGAVPVGVWGRHELGGLCGDERGRGQEGGTDPTDVGL